MSKKESQIKTDLREYRRVENDREVDFESDAESDLPPSTALKSYDDKLIDPNRKRLKHRNVGLVAQIDALTKDGTQIVHFFSSVMKGQIKGFGPKDRLEAAKFLAERKWGKSPDTVVHAHAHAVAEIPDGITNQMLMALARGEQLRLADVVRAPEPIEGEYSVEEAEADPESGTGSN